MARKNGCLARTTMVQVCTNTTDTEEGTPEGGRVNLVEHSTRREREATKEKNDKRERKRERERERALDWQAIIASLRSRDPSHFVPLATN